MIAEIERKYDSQVSGVFEANRALHAHPDCQLSFGFIAKERRAGYGVKRKKSKGLTEISSCPGLIHCPLKPSDLLHATRVIK